MRRLFTSAVPLAVLVVLAAACTPAPGGTTTTTSTTTTAVPVACAPGTFNSTDGNEPCTPAPPGTFVSTAGALQATPCAIGTFQPDAGQQFCLVAPLGTFVADQGAVAATDASPGFFVDVQGAAEASACPLGRFQPDAGQQSCLIAPIGTFVAQVAATQATACPAGTTTLAAGATSPSDCVPVAAETGACAAGIGSLDYVPGIVLGDPDGPVAEQTAVTMALSGCSSSAVAGSFTGTYTGSGDTVPLYVNGETDNSFLTLPIGTTVSLDAGTIAWSDGATSAAESELVLVTDPVLGRAYELRWSITSGRFSGTSPVGLLGTADILDVPTLTYTGADLTLGTVVFTPTL